MLNKNKIRLMSRLALYDRKFGALDRKKGQYFKWDYIYFRNFWTRAGVFSGCMIISMFYILNKILIEQTDILMIDYKLEATKIGFFTIAALVIYTVIGTVVAKGEYKKSSERFNAYISMLDKIDEMDGLDGQHGFEGKRDSGFDEQKEPYPAHESYEAYREPLPYPRKTPDIDGYVGTDKLKEGSSQVESGDKESSVQALMRYREVKRRNGNADGKGDLL